MVGPSTRKAWHCVFEVSNLRWGNKIPTSRLGCYLTDQDHKFNVLENRKPVKNVMHMMQDMAHWLLFYCLCLSVVVVDESITVSNEFSYYVEINAQKLIPTSVGLYGGSRRFSRTSTQLIDRKNGWVFIGAESSGPEPNLSPIFFFSNYTFSSP